MSVKYSGENTLTYLLGLIKTALGGKVDKESGKGLSSNDFTTELKNKLDGIDTGANRYTHPDSAAGAKTSGLYKITTDAKGHVTAADEVVKKDITDLGIPAQDTTYGTGTASTAGLTKLYTGTGDNTDGTMTQSAIKSALNNKADTSDIPTVPAISTSIETDATSDTKTASPKAVKSYVDGKISSTYKPAGSVAFASLPSTLNASLLGNVYNVTDAFTSTAKFLEGAGKSYPAGTNVVVVKSGESYLFDVLPGFIDLSGYILESEIVEFTNEEVQTIWNSVFTA